jgi:RND family efflux transporter MFP subunit
MTRYVPPPRVPTLIALAIVAATGAACGRQSAGQAASAERPPVAVAIAPASIAEFTESVDVVGSLTPKFAADVKSEISGVVTAVYVTEWVPVRRGDRLARLDTSETEAAIQALRAGEAQARTAEARARREYERAQQLKQYGLITPQNFDDAATAVEAGQAVTAAAQAQVRAAEARLAKAFLKAPIDGVVALRGVNVGDRVENMGGGDPLFRIVDNRLLELTVTVPSSRAALVAVGQPIEFATDALPGRSFTGKVMFINPALDEASRTAKVIAEVPNRDGALRGGAFVKGRIHVATRSGVLQVPREALLNWNVESATADVFVVREDRADRRTVKVGRASGGRVEVTEGLQPGDPVVTRGAFALRPGDRVSVATGEGA